MMPRARTQLLRVDMRTEDWPEHRPACVMLADYTRRMAREEPAPPQVGFVPLCCSHKRAELRSRLGSSSRPAIE